MKLSQEQIDRFWSHVDKPGGSEACWRWNGFLQPNTEHGRFRVGKRMEVAHRVSYFLSRGRLPKSPLKVLHCCGLTSPDGKDHGWCCNPKHLYAGTVSDNLNDAYSRGRKQPNRGEDNRNAKLTEVQVKQIWDRICAGDPTHVIAQDYGVYKSIIYKIRSGKLWSHIAAPGTIPKRQHRADGKTLTGEQRNEIVVLAKTMKQKDIAAKFGVSQAQISRVLSSKR